MNFEVIDNCFQVAVLACAGMAACVEALKHKDRRFLILALFYICVSMGTLYWVLYLAIFGNVPQVFYVSEISWMAAYLFLLSFQMLRIDKARPFFSLPALFCALFTWVVILVFQIFGPAYLVSAAFAGVISAIVYLAVWKIRLRDGRRLLDFCLLLCVVLQILVYVVSGFMKEFTHFNLYFAVDITLTSSFAALLLLALQEVAEK